MAGRTDDLKRELAALLPRLRRFARALTGSAADADDLVQASIERALRSADQWRSGAKPDAWMFTIMKHAWIDEIRTRTASAKVLAPEADALNAASDGAQTMEARLHARAVQAVVATLPDEQRLAVALVFVEGLSYREAAEVMETPIGTVTSRLARARATIEAALTEKAS
jgi:RNA polymerase sigma factor (sigma-70 family)